jgi:LVIVD repeat
MRQYDQRFSVVGVVLLVTLLGMSSPAQAFGPIATRADCGPNDRQEGGLQGQTTLAERFAPGEFRAYNCNLELVGQTVGEGVSPGFAITDKCAYVAQWRVSPPLTSALENPGLMVIDVSDPNNPKVTKYLQTPGMLRPSESLIVNLKRKLLIGQNLDTSSAYGNSLDVYDISDCLNPVLKFSGIIPGYIFHGGDFNADGTLLWGATGPVTRQKDPDIGDTLTALDISDPSRPKVVAKWRTDDPENLVRFHGVSVSDDGNTLYFTIGEHLYTRVNGKVVPSPNQGIGILDVSDVQARKSNPQITMIGKPYYWDDILHNQYVHPFEIDGHRYLWENRLDGVISNEAQIHTGDSGIRVGKSFRRPTESPEMACSAGKPAWGYVSIIDIENPATPKRVSALKLEVQDAKNCLATAYDPVYGHGYSPLNCNVDNYQDARMIVCSFAEGGVRVFDIRDVMHPKEIAYYKPAAVGDAPRPGSPYQTFRDISGSRSGALKFHSADGVSDTAFARDGKEIWITSFDGGFHVLRFSDRFMTKEKGLFARTDTCDGGLRTPHGCP